MTKLDTDGDGQLSFDEFKEMLQKELRIEQDLQKILPHQIMLPESLQIFLETLRLHLDFSRIKHFGYSLNTNGQILATIEAH